ncbi:MAG: DUF6056 family protein [Bacteroidota bacterium]|nr:DUF6056 family protein [Bacteroidota bacterium]
MKISTALSETKIESLLIGFLILMIVPFIFLFYFNHPSGDDFGFPDNTKIFGFRAAQEITYNNWTGKFFSNAILSYNPLYFKSITGYKILTLILMIAFFYVIFLFISEIISGNLKWKQRFLFSLTIFFLYLYGMPSVSQGFYWITGSIVYQFGLILIMVFLILYIRLSKTNKTSERIFYTSASALLLIAIAGCSEMSMGLIVLIIAILILTNIFTERKLHWRLIIFAALVGAASYVIISAPGNQLRAEFFPERHQLFNSIYLSFTFLIQNFFSWIFLTPLLPLTLLLVPVFGKLYKGDERKLAIFSVNPFYSYSAFIIILLILIFLPVWSMGKEPVRRTFNFIYFVFLIGWFYNAIVLFYFINKKSKTSIKKIPQYIYILFTLILLSYLLKQNNVRTAYADLLRGTAYKYNNELNKRYEFISQSSSDSCEVLEIKNIPRTIFVFEITGDSKNIYNEVYAHYFNKKSIVLKKEDP